MTQVSRPQGQVYQPEAISKTMARYAFVKAPSLDELANNIQKFQIGKFEDVQIQELGIYNDGIIVSSKSNTAILDSFVEDLFRWLSHEFGIVPQINAKHERHHESQLVIKSEVDLASVIKPATAVLNLFSQTWQDEFDAKYNFAGFQLDCGLKYTGRRKPIHFNIERRIGVSFDENVFFSTAPLSTNAHLDLLGKLEALARKGD